MRRPGACRALVMMPPPPEMGTTRPRRGNQKEKTDSERRATRRAPWRGSRAPSLLLWRMPAPSEAAGARDNTERPRAARESELKCRAAAQRSGPGDERDPPC